MHHTNNISPVHPSLFPSSQSFRGHGNRMMRPARFPRSLMTQGHPNNIPRFQHFDAGGRGGGFYYTRGNPRKYRNYSGGSNNYNPNYHHPGYNGKMDHIIGNGGEQYPHRQQQRHQQHPFNISLNQNPSSNGNINSVSSNNTTVFQDALPGQETSGNNIVIENIDGYHHRHRHHIETRINSSNLEFSSPSNEYEPQQPQYEHLDRRPHTSGSSNNSNVSNDNDTVASSVSLLFTSSSSSSASSSTSESPSDHSLDPVSDIETSDVTMDQEQPLKDSLFQQFHDSKYNNLDNLSSSKEVAKISGLEMLDDKTTDEIKSKYILDEDGFIEACIHGHSANKFNGKGSSEVLSCYGVFFRPNNEKNLTAEVPITYDRKFGKSAFILGTAKAISIIKNEVSYNRIHLKMETTFILDNLTSWITDLRDESSYTIKDWNEKKYFNEIRELCQVSDGMLIKCSLVQPHECSLVKECKKSVINLLNEMKKVKKPIVVASQSSFLLPFLPSATATSPIPTITSDSTATNATTTTSSSGNMLSTEETPSS